MRKGSPVRRASGLVLRPPPPPRGVCSRANWRGCRNVLREPVVKSVIGRKSKLPLRGGFHDPDHVEGHSSGVVSEMLMMPNWAAGDADMAAVLVG